MNDRRNKYGRRRVNYTTTEAAIILDMESSVLADLINQGKIKTMLIGNVINISLFEIHRYIMDNTNVKG